MKGVIVVGVEQTEDEIMKETPNQAGAAKPEVIRLRRRRPFVGGPLLNPEPLVAKAGKAKSPKYQPKSRLRRATKAEIAEHAKKKDRGALQFEAP